MADTLDVVELALPVLDAEVTCQARVFGRYCGVAPVTHWAILTCTGCGVPTRRPICAPHVAEARVRWPSGLTTLRHKGCGGHARVEYVPAGGQ